jgi:hypothetical protein
LKEGNQTLGEPRTYAEAILVVCKQYVESPLARASGVTALNNRDRIEDIMNNRIGVRLSNPKRAAIAVGIALALGIPFAAGMLTTSLQAYSGSIAQNQGLAFVINPGICSYPVNLNHPFA